MARAAQPITDDELKSLFAMLEGVSLALAVSGGCDSTALMHLVARWAQRHPADASGQRIVVLTVDHRLRPEAADEARAVCAEAERLGLPSRLLVWQGPHPASGLQASARAARYRLFGEAIRDLSADGTKWHLVTAHHLEDQAETFLMRLARGSGIDGLSGMRDAATVEPETTDGDEMFSYPVLRPLLATPKDRLAATLQATGIPWIEDPSNKQEDFERVRMRNALVVLKQNGIDASDIARSAARLRRARAAIDAMTGSALAMVAWHEGAYGSCDAARFIALPDEIGMRILQRLLEAYGGTAPPARLSEIEALYDRLRRATSTPRDKLAATLGGCRIDWRRGAGLRVWRESGRTALPSVMVGPGASSVWDRRFRVDNAVDSKTVTIRAIGSISAADRERLGTATPLPPGALEALPGVWIGDELVADPVAGGKLAGLAVTFLGSPARSPGPAFR